MVYPDVADAEATLPWEILINDQDRFAGQDATEEIAAGLMSLFHLDWTWEVVYKNAQPHMYLGPHPTNMRISCAEFSCLDNANRGTHQSNLNKLIV